MQLPDLELPDATLEGKLRGLEGAAYASSVLVILLTYLMVGTAQASEWWLTSALVIEAWGFGAYALLRLGAVAACFGIVYWLHSRNARAWALRGALLTASISSLNAALDALTVAEGGLPESIRVGTLAGYAAAVVLVAALAWARPDPRPALEALRAALTERRHLRARQAVAVIACLTLITAGMPATLFGAGGSLQSVQNVEAGHTWSYTGNTWNSGQTDYPSGIAEFGGNYWIADGGTAYKYDTSWTYQSSAVLSSTGSAQDFHKTSGGNILVPDNTDDDVDVYDSNWNYLSSHVVSTQTTTPVGVTEGPNGKYYLVGLGTNVYVYNSDWTLSNTISLSTQTTDMAGIELGANGYWWVLDKTSTQVYKYDSSWTYTGTSYDVGTEDPTPQNLMQADNSGGNWYYLGTDTSTTTNDIYEYGGHAGNPVEGYVKDASGSAIGSATATLESSGGSVLQTVTTNSTGGYKFTGVRDQSGLTVTASKSGYVNDTSGSFSMSGSPVTVPNLTLGGNIQGVVRNQEGAPVQGATVEVWMVDDSNTTTDPGETVQDAQEDLLQTTSRAVPRDAFSPNLDPIEQLHNSSTGSGDMVLVHDRGAWAKHVEIAGFDTGLAEHGTSSLKTPLTQLEPNKDYVFSCWSPIDGGLVEDPIDSRIEPGASTSCNMSVESIGPGNSTITRYERSTEPLYETSYFAGAGTRKTHEGRVLSLPEGYYRLSSTESPVTTVVRVGQPEKIPRQFHKDLSTANGTQADIAKEIDGLINNQTFARATVQTGPNGRFSHAVPDGYSTVAVTAFKGGELLKGVKNPTLTDLRTQVETQDYQGSIYLSSAPHITHPPDTSIQLTMVEIQNPTYEDLNAYLSRLSWLRGLVDEDAMMEVAGLFNDNLGDLSREELESRSSELQRLVEENQALEERVNELLQEGGSDTTYNDIANGGSGSGGVTRADLEQLQQAMEQAIAGTSPTVNIQYPEVEEDVEPGQNGEPTLINLRLPLQANAAGTDSSVSADSTSVLVHWANGSSSTMNQSYWSVEEKTGSSVRGGEVVISDYPIPANEPVASFQILTANSEGIGNGQYRVQNPAFDGEIPRISSFDASTLRPGPSEVVTLGVTPADESSYQSLSSATVYAPNGSTTSSTLSNGELEFTTAGKGTHLIHLTMTDVDGNEYTEALRLKAGAQDVDMPATVRVRSGTIGVYALTGDGVSSAEVKSSSNRQSMTIGAKFPSETGKDELHVYTGEALQGSEYGLNIRVLQGSEEQSGRAMSVVAHVPRVQEGATVYREGKKPITSGEGTQYGLLNRTADAATIKTYTDSSGSVSISVNNDPGWIGTLEFAARQQVPSLPTLQLTVPVVQLEAAGADLVNSAGAAFAGGFGGAAPGGKA